MEYRYCEDRNWEDLSSGRVLCGVHGAPNFPVRLGCELYRRALSHCGKKKGIRLYDCCCGGGYLLTVLGLLNQETISHIYASDIDEGVLETAGKNLSLLGRKGMETRKQELLRLSELYGKPSHALAVESADRLLALLTKDIPCTVFTADAGSPLELEDEIDILITDVPYGILTAWEGQAGARQEEALQEKVLQQEILLQEARTELNAEKPGGLDRLVRNLTGCLGEKTLFVIVTDKGQKMQTEGLKILEKGNVGKRRFYIFQKMKKHIYI